MSTNGATQLEEAADLLTAFIKDNPNYSKEDGEKINEILKASSATFDYSEEKIIELTNNFSTLQQYKREREKAKSDNPKTEAENQNKEGPNHQIRRSNL